MRRSRMTPSQSLMSASANQKPLREVHVLEMPVTITERLKVVEHTKKWVKCNKKGSYCRISSRLKLGLVSLGNQTNLEFERLSTTEFGVVAGEASTTLPGLWCECAKSRAARQNRRG